MNALKAETIKARIGLSGPALNRIPGPAPAIPDHQMIRCIGQGSYGEVWLARNAVGTWRAVKVVYRHNFSDPRPYEREFAGIQSYEPISRTNEGLIDVLQIGRNDAEGYFYYVMELADSAAQDQTAAETPEPSGGTKLEPARNADLDPKSYVPKTLSKVIRQRGRLSYEECITLGLTLNLALAHLHHHGLIHRDVKPSNIVFVNGVPKLTDIGLVTDLEGAQSFVGTEGFIPPEGPNSPQADLYALGKVLYEASMGKDRNEFPEPVTQLGLDADSRALMELNAVLVRACAPNIKERYRRAEEMNADLALLHNGESVRNKHAVARRLRWMTRIGAGTVAVLVLAVVPYSLAIREAHRATEQRQVAVKEANKSRAVAQILKNTLYSSAPAVALGRDTKLMRDLLDQTAAGLDTNVTSFPEVESELRGTLGDVYLALGEYKKSEDMLRRAVELYRDQFGEGNSNWVHCLSQLSLAVSAQGRGVEAEKLQGRVLLIRTALSNELDVAESYLALGHILAGENKIAESEQMFRKCRAIRERLLGRDNVGVADALNGIATALSSQGQWEAAETMWREAIRINCQALTERHPNHIWMLNGIVQAQLNQKKYAEAEASARECINLELAILAPDHPLRASTLTRLAMVLQEQGRTSEAKTNLEQALTIWTRRLSNQDPSIGATVTALFDLLFSERDFSEAKRVFDQVSVAGDRPNPTLVMVCGNYLARTGQWRAAADKYQQVLRLDPENHLACQALASLYVQLEDWPAYRQFTSSLLEKFGSVTNDPRIADRIAKSCLMLPPPDQQALATATNLANVAVTFDANAARHPWFRFCKGLAEFRAGNFESAKKWMAKVLESKSEGSSRDIEAYMVLAMAETELHNQAAATAAFEEGNRLARLRLREVSSGDIESGWTDWILAHQLMREAATGQSSLIRQAAVSP
ncbi:MAG TPA: tetratricopeptide repeat protein [Verrucomicrobiae bacterium]|nr:tetratricopeptide repeat protein [Verrucomicrobiae bacterium]